MKNGLLLAGVLALAVGGAEAGTLYRWVDQSGKVHYSDEPPAAEGMQVEQKSFHIPQTDENADLPYETRHAQEKFPVTLYTANNCKAPCDQARDFLNKRGIPFKEKALLSQKDIDNFKQLSGSDQTPTLSVGNTYLNTFEAGRWNNELDVAGYPKTAPYRAKNPEPAEKANSGGGAP